MILQTSGGTSYVLYQETHNRDAPPEATLLIHEGDSDSDSDLVFIEQRGRWIVINRGTIKELRKVLAMYLQSDKSSKPSKPSNPPDPESKER